MEQKKRTEIALVPGSYDPVTKGHEYLIAKAAEEYEKVYAVIFVNPEKQCRFSLEKRLEMLEAVCKKYPNVTADADTGMQYAYARRVGATVAVRGWRSEEDLKYEQKMAKFNAENLPGYRMELWHCPPELEKISSTAVRRKMEENGDISSLIPEEILPYIAEK